MYIFVGPFVDPFLGGLELVMCVCWTALWDALLWHSPINLVAFWRVSVSLGVPCHVTLLMRGFQFDMVRHCCLRRLGGRMFFGACIVLLGSVS